MKKTHCACGTPLKGNERARGYSRCATCREIHRQQMAADVVFCVECPRPLTRTERSKGIKRCLVCRRARPFTPTPPKQAPKAHGPGISIATPKKPMATLNKPKATHTESWWLQLDRAQLKAETERRYPG